MLVLVPICADLKFIFERRSEGRKCLERKQAVVQKLRPAC